MALPQRSPDSYLSRTAAAVGGRLLDIVTSRSVVVVCTSCAVLYAAFWVVAVLQTNGIIHTALPIPVADAVVLRRSGARLQSAAFTTQQSEQRDQALAKSQVAPDNASAVAPTSALTLEIQSAPPVDLWVTDDQGGQVGTNPDNGLVRLQLASASYSGKGSDPQLVSIPHAAGQYHIQLFGAGDGNFQLTVRVFRDQDVDHAVQFSGSGEVFQDTLLETLANVGQQDDGVPTLDVSPVQVLVAGNVPSGLVAGATTSPSASPSPSEQPASSDQGSPSPAPAPPVPAAVAPGPAVVVRPNPAPRPPIPLPPLPPLPPAVVNALAPSPSPSPSVNPAGAYGSPGQLSERQFDSGVSQPLQKILKAPEAALNDLSNR